MGSSFSNQVGQPQNNSSDNMKPSQYSTGTFPQYTNFLNSATYNNTNLNTTTTDSSGNYYRNYPSNSANTRNIELSNSTKDLLPNFYQTNSAGSSGYIFLLGLLY